MLRSIRPILFLLAFFFFATRTLPAAESEPLRVAIVGLVHGHVAGFFSNSAQRPEIRIVGISDPSRALFDFLRTKILAANHRCITPISKKMLVATKPQAVLVYSSTFDHRKIVELCAKHGVSVMMEKPLAVSFADAQAIQRAASAAKIQVLVNYETSWYRSNHGAFDLVHSGAIGPVRKVVVHDGHQGPQEINVQPEFLKWLSDPKLNGGGALFDFGCYGADLMTWLMDGQRPLSVTAVTQQIKPDVYPRVDDEATVVLTYPHAQAILQASWTLAF